MQMAKILLILLVLSGIGFVVWRSCTSCHPSSPPVLDLDEWWGPKDIKGKVDASIIPFKVAFSQELVQDLKSRLSKHRPLTPPLEGVGFEYGFNTNYLEKVLDYWQNKYDFTKREAFLNQHPQYKTNIQGLDIHFIRVKPQVGEDTKVLPLLLLHGWPGSVREFYETIPLLTKKQPGHDFVFEVIIPSLPGYGFSDGAARPGLAPVKIAVIMRNLMHRLGFKKYYIQGGDWGAIIVASMSTFFQDEVLGQHTNVAFIQTPCNLIKTILGSFIPSLVVDEKLAHRMYPLGDIFSFFIEESGYLHIQATKPDTVGVGLTDSPAGLAAYILEKFSVWTVKEYKKLPDGGITKKYTLDQLLDNIMIYWSSNSITTSVRLYAEEMTSANRGLKLERYLYKVMSSLPTKVPTWVLQADNELLYQPPHMLKTKYTNLIDTTVLHDGGHFIAFEQPETLAKNVFKAVKAFTQWDLKNVQEKSEL